MRKQKEDYNKKTVLQQLEEDKEQMTKITWNRNGKAYSKTVPKYSVEYNLRLINRDLGKDIQTIDLTVNQ